VGNVTVTRRFAIASVIVILGAVAWGMSTYLDRPRMWIPVARFIDGAPGTSARHAAMADEKRHVLPLKPNGFEGIFETPVVSIPRDAELGFALGAAVAPRGDRVVTFEIRACREAACDGLFSERVDFAVVGVEHWQERRIPLARFAGESRRFVFRVVTTAPTTQPFVANPTVFAPTSRPRKAHNVILISLDTLRADRLGSYGYAHDTSPFIDATFARGGVLFEHCTAAATTTTPSHMTMFTSLPPSVHDVGLDNVKALPDWIPTLPETLRAAGFTTGAITENGWVTFVQGFGRGFDTYAENKGPDLMETKGQADVTFHAAGEWLRRHRDERFFLFLHTYQVHDPYVPPPEYMSLFEAQDVPSSAASASANYDREIRFTDDVLRQLFATMRDLGIDDDTIVVVTSDHGEQFGEHGCLKHGEHLYQEVALVPLMIHGPGIPHGVRVAEPVGLIDVMPTILQLAGVPAPEHAMGVSLTQALQSEHAPADRRLFIEAWNKGLCYGDRQTLPALGVRLGAWTLARYHRDGANRYEQYDLANDPRERTNRYESGSATSRELQSILDGYQKDCAARAEMLRGRARPGMAAGEEVELDARQREKLRALGYIQ
jgi:arylsulfatase A-like enzyme